MNKIKRYFEKKRIKRELRAITSKRVKRMILQHFENESINKSIMEITNVVVKNKKCCIFITITLERPGILIGKAGRTIDGLEKYLERIFEKPVKISIKESKLWTT